MRNGNGAYLVFFILGSLLLALAANHWLLVLLGITGVVFIVLFLAVLSGWFQEKLFEFVNVVVSDNNYIFYVVAMMTIFLFIGSLWYGAGEPVFVTAMRSVQGGLSRIYDDSVQKDVNKQLMRGKSITNDQVVNIKAILAASKKCDKKTVRPPDETDSDYREKLNNYLEYDCFETDAEVEKIQKESRSNSTAVGIIKQNLDVPSQVSKLLQPDVTTKSTRTWFWWKAFIAFLFIMCPLSFIVSFHDEVADGLEKLLREVKQLKERSSAPTESAGAGGIAKAKEVVHEQGGLIMKILSVDIIAEMIQVLIKALRG